MRFISEAERDLIRQLLLERGWLLGICRVMKVSLRWLLKFIGELYEALPDDLNVALPDQLSGQVRLLRLGAAAIERKEMLALSPEEVAHFIKVAQSDRYGVMFTFAVITGMRPGEYMGLKWSDINFERGTVTVRRSLLIIPTEKGERFGEPKTPQSRRAIPLPTVLLRQLREHRRQQAEERLRAESEWAGLDLVFCTEIGTPLNLHNVRVRNFKPVLRRAGLSEKLRLYDLRHMCAPLLLTEGVHPKVTSERLGHSSIVLTLKRSKNSVSPGLAHYRHTKRKRATLLSPLIY